MNPPAFAVPDLETMNRLLPAFEFKALISSNDYGAVFMARQRSLERDVAIKILSPQVSGLSGFRESFETTARMMAKLNHPNLIGVYDSGFVSGMLFFVMEFVPGKSLEHSSKGKQVEKSQALRLVSEICDGLAHAQDHGIVHGNLTPSNILLNRKAEPKIGNFGFSHSAEENRATGAPSPYTAPEAANPAPGSGSRADIFAAGAILYELLTGRPHSPDAPPPSTLSKCGTDIDAIWKQATHPDPARRFPDMRALHKALTGMPEAPRAAAAPLAPAAPGPAVRPPGPSFQPPVQRPAPRKKINVGVIVQLIILVGLMIATPSIWKKLQDNRDRKAKQERDARAQMAEAERNAYDEDIRKAQEEARLAKAKKNSPINPPGRNTTGSTGDSMDHDTPAEEDVSPEADSGPETGSRPRDAGVTPATDTLTMKAKDLIVAADRKRTEKLAANVRKVSWDLDIYLRNLPKSDQSVWAPHILRLKNSAANNRIPDSVPRSSGIQLSEKMAKIAQDGAAMQDKIDAEFLTETERIRTAYISRLRDSLSQAEKAGQSATAASLTESLENAADAAGWLDSFGVEAKPENPQVKGNPTITPDTRKSSTERSGNPLVE